jgi:integrase/recombinase XerD
MKTKKINPVITIYPETREPKSDGTIPIKIRVTFDRKRKYFAVKTEDINPLLKAKKLHEFMCDGIGDFSLDGKVIEKTLKPAPRGKFSILNDVLATLRKAAQETADSLKVFSFENFQDIYRKKYTPVFNDVFTKFETYINNLKGEGRISTAISYNCTFTSLKNYYTKDKLPFENITVEFLKKYETWMTEQQGNSVTTVGIYMRQLRTIYNQRPDDLKLLDYPFGQAKNHQYEIPKSNGRKIALTIGQLKEVLNYKPEPESYEEYYLDFWKLQYLMNGINVTDLLQLRHENLKDGFVVFVRAKTKRTKKKEQKIRIPISSEINRLLLKYGQNIKSSKTYLFDRLKENMTPDEKQKVIQYHASLTTKTMKRVCRKLELPDEVTKKISSYASRHTFASVLMKKNAPMSYVSKQLGHTSLETTQNYLSSFEDEQLQQWQSTLTDL